VHVLVPSPEMPSGRAALRRLLGDTERLDVAVAFVTHSGVRLLGELLAECGTPPKFRIVVRGGPVSDPDAVIALADLSADVRVVMGAHASRFHPKLWISRNADWLRVLSGSGNLTAGGLDQNHEQFELLGLRLPDHELEADAHQKRWNAFFALGSPLADAIASPAWAEWIAQQSRRRQLKAELAKLDRRLADSGAPAPAGEGMRWLERVLQDAVPDGYTAELSPRAWGERVQVDAGEDRGFKYLFLMYGHPDEGDFASPALDLLIYAGDTLNQARRLYSSMDERTQARIIELAATPGWSVRPNFHFGFRTRGVLDDEEPTDLPAYLEYWRSHIDEHHQRPAEEWPAVLEALASQQVVSSQYPRRFSDEVGRRSPLHPRPGLLIARAWPLSEAEALARGGHLASAVKGAINHALAVIGERSLQ
jgi:nucleotide-binding universal stress UspA family protein